MITGGPHSLSESRQFPVDHVPCGFGCHIPGRNTGSTAGHYQIAISVVRPGGELVGDLLPFVGQDVQPENLHPTLAQKGGQSRAAGVLALAAATLVAENQQAGAQGPGFVVVMMVVTGHEVGSSLATKVPLLPPDLYSRRTGPIVRDLSLPLHMS